MEQPGPQKSTTWSSDPFESPLKLSKSFQQAKIIEPLPGPSLSDWSKKSDIENGARSRNSAPSKQQAVRNTSIRSSKRSGGETENNINNRKSTSSASTSSASFSNNCVVTDRFGRPMTVRQETVKVLKQLPDLSFLSARTLMYNPEQKQIVQDLGAMINRKMPG